MDGGKRLTFMLRWLGTVLLGIALLWVVVKVLEQIEIVVVIICGAIFVAYVLYPSVRFFHRRGLPRWGAIAVVYLIIAGIVVSFVLFAGPSLINQVKSFSADVPQVVASLQSVLLNAHAAVISALPLAVRQGLAHYLNIVSGDLQNSATVFGAHVVQFFFSIVTIISSCVIIPILAFYLLLDAENLMSGFIHLFPLKSQNRVALVLDDVDHVLGGFFRGQIIVAAFVAVAVSIALLLLRIEYPFLIGVFAGVVDMIPYLGGIAGAIPAVILAFVAHGFLRALLVVLAFIIIYQIEGHVVAPNVVSKRVGLTALLVIIAVLIGAEVGGIPGMFVAVPVAATVRMIWRRLARPLEVTSTGPPSPEEPDESKKVVIIAKS